MLLLEAQFGWEADGLLGLIVHEQEELGQGIGPHACDCSDPVPVGSVWS